MRRHRPLILLALTLAACTGPAERISSGRSFDVSSAPSLLADDGSADVQAEIAAFDASPALSPGGHATDPALAALLAGGATGALEVIVTYDETQTTAFALAHQLTGLGAGIVRFKHLPMMFALGGENAVRQMAGLPGVRSVYLNKPLHYFLHESVATIKADQAWALGYTGGGVGAAILDSGVDGLYSPGLTFGSKTIANVKYLASVKDLVTFDPNDPTPRPAGALFLENLSNSETSSGHGTHVAGIVAGTGGGSVAGWYRGVAPGANIVGIGTGDVLFVFWALAGFDFILDHQQPYNIKVVNNSWGTNGAFDPNDPINVATRAVHDAGVTVVFAAGNCGRGGDPDCPPPEESQLNPYAVAPWVIGVSATCKVGVQDPTNSASQCADPVSGRAPVLANFSSVGLPNTIYHPDIAAPGVRIVSTRSSLGVTVDALAASNDARFCNISIQHLPYYTCISGTSMATPHIVGVVALMQGAAGGRLTPDQVLGILRRTATHLDGYADWEVGAGLVNALAAVQRAARR